VFTTGSEGAMTSGRTVTMQQLRQLGKICFKTSFTLDLNLAQPFAAAFFNDVA
jgi:hypothetical protein